MGRLIVGLAGRAGTGKSTCARYLVELFGAVEHSFARPLKSLARELFGLAEEQVNGTQAQKEAVDPRWGKSPRQLLVALGDGARRHVADDVWIRGVLRSIERQAESIAVISDVRYPNEAEAVHAAGGVVVRLRCPDAASSADPNAPSERGVDEIAAEHVAIELSVPRSLGAILLLDQFAFEIYPHLVDAIGADAAVAKAVRS